MEGEGEGRRGERGETGGFIEDRGDDGVAVEAFGELGEMLFGREIDRTGAAFVAPVFASVALVLVGEERTGEDFSDDGFLRAAAERLASAASFLTGADSLRRSKVLDAAAEAFALLLMAAVSFTISSIFGLHLLTNSSNRAGFSMKSLLSLPGLAISLKARNTTGSVSDNISSSSSSWNWRLLGDVGCGEGMGESSSSFNPFNGSFRKSSSSSSSSSSSPFSTTAK